MNTKISWKGQYLTNLSTWHWHSGKTQPSLCTIPISRYPVMQYPNTKAFHCPISIGIIYVLFSNVQIPKYKNIAQTKTVLTVKNYIWIKQRQQLWIVGNNFSLAFLWREVIALSTCISRFNLFCLLTKVDWRPFMIYLWRAPGIFVK